LSFVLAGCALAFGSLFQDEIIKFLLSMFRHELVADTSDILSGRSELWSLAGQFIREKPVFGHGIGSSQSLLSRYEWFFVESQGLHFHNSYLTIAVETGGLGIIAAGFTFVLTLAGGFQVINRAQREKRPGWPQRALPLALTTGALAHAFFETWLLSAGNANMIVMWVCFLLLQTKPIVAHPPGSTRTQWSGTRRELEFARRRL
jgi:O-antigen ligase